MAKAPRKPHSQPSKEDPAGPKTTRAPAAKRRSRDSVQPRMTRGDRVLDAVPDRIDVRDWFYQPNLTPLPDRLVNCSRVPVILDQGQEGACTGYALAAVVNYLLGARHQRASVSPRMIYEMARRYDEWPGEQYEGSSARGAMIGLVRHGVCLDESWPADLHGPQHLSEPVAREARGIPGGAFYRVLHREVRDMHAALNEIGVLYATIMVHDGWFQPGPQAIHIDYVEQGQMRTLDLPIIRREGRATSGHAVAIVGYTGQGFVVQNSWGEEWGWKGFAFLPYEDWLMHATDVWAVQLGVPLEIDLWAQGATETTAGLQRAATAVPLADIRPYVVDVGNNGELSLSGDYWTTEEDVQRLFTQLIPERTSTWVKRRIMLYLHGGLNSETAVAQRIVAFRDVMLENEIYPLHVMWESDAARTIFNLVEDLFTDVDERAATAAWLRRTREGLLEARDWTLELTVARPGRALWREMKENARLSSNHPDDLGAMQLIAKHAASLLAAANEQGGEWELHIVAHSAGAIYLAHAMRHLQTLGIVPQSVQLLAPALTTALYRETIQPLVQVGRCPLPDLYILSDAGERDDDVGPYGKSLLYLVSNAFEDRRGTPLLGMQRFIDGAAAPQGVAVNASEIDVELAEIFAGRLIVAGAPPLADGLSSQSDSHGGFDNDPMTMNSVLHRILGKGPQRLFSIRDLQF